MSKKIIPFEDKYASGFCRAKFVKGKGQIKEINEKRDAQGGFSHPYVNTQDGKTVVIKPGDKIEVNGKTVIKVIGK